MKSAYYQAERAKGEKYEAFIGARLKLGKPHVGLKAQLAHGDFASTKGNVEVKSQLEWREHQAIFIELFEYQNRRWFQSGLWAKADWTWLVTGDYTVAFLFRRSALDEYCAGLPKDRFILNRFGTSVGFRMPYVDMVRVAAKQFDFTPAAAAPAPAAVLTGPPCCGLHAGEQWKGKPQVPACRLCSSSTDYWRTRGTQSTGDAGHLSSGQPERALPTPGRRAGAARDGGLRRAQPGAPSARTRPRPPEAAAHDVPAPLRHPHQDRRGTVPARTQRPEVFALVPLDRAGLEEDARGEGRLARPARRAARR